MTRTPIPPGWSLEFLETLKSTPPNLHMRSIFASLVYFPCFLSIMAEGLTRYQTAPPNNAIVVHNRQSLNDLVKVYPETILHSENGGYYLKNMDEEVIAVAGDDLCEELDGALASIDAMVSDDEDEDNCLRAAHLTKSEDLA
jgi:hypothetical protein